MSSAKTSRDRTDASLDAHPSSDATPQSIAGSKLVDSLRNIAAGIDGPDPRIRDMLRARLFDLQPAGLCIGRYRVLDRLGEGGMGHVYSAYDDKLDRKVALKLVKRSGDHVAISRLEREAVAMAQLSHPNIVQVYGVGEHEGQVFVAMEFVRGHNVAEWLGGANSGVARTIEDDAGAGLARAPERETTRSWREILDVFIQAGRGLAAAHAVGLVHRDFKPANVMIGDDGRVRVLDFGLARIHTAPLPAVADALDAASASGDQRRVELTTIGAVMGTPAYMSPEQFMAGAVEAKSDQFSYCVALYEALYGERPFPGDVLADLQRSVVSGRIKEPPAGTSVPSWIREPLVRGLSVASEERWPTMDALLAALSRDPARQRRRRLTQVATAAMVLLTSVFGVWGWKQRQLVRIDERHAAEVAAELEEEARRIKRDEELLASTRRAQHDSARISAARELVADEPTTARLLLADVENLNLDDDWASLAARALMHPVSTAILRGHTDRVFISHFSPDGQRVVTSSFDRTARIWRADGRGDPLVLRGHRDVVRYAAFSPDGAMVMTASDDASARIWDSGTGDLLAVLRGHSGALTEARFGPNGRYVATGSTDSTARLWELDGFAPIRVFQHEDTVWFLEFSPDGTTLGTASADGTARIWSLNDTRSPRVLRGHADTVWRVRFSPDGQRVATSSSDRTARIWSLSDPEAEPVVVRPEGARVVDVEFSPDGRQLATAAEIRLALWTIDDPAAPIKLDLFSRGIRDIAYSPTGEFLAAVVGDGTPRISKADGRGPQVRLPGASSSFYVDYSVDGKLLHVDDSAAEAWIWEPGRESLLSSTRRVCTQSAAELVEYSPDGDDVLVSCRDGAIKLGSLVCHPALSAGLRPGLT